MLRNVLKILCIAAMMSSAGSGFAAADAFDDFDAATDAFRRVELRQSVELFTKAIEAGEFTDVDLASAHLNRGIAFSRLTEYQEALADFDRALELNPGLTKAYRGRGEAHAGLDNYEAAIADYDLALDRDSSSETVFNLRGEARVALGDHGSAVDDFLDAVRLDPRFAVARSNLRAAYEALGRTDRIDAVDSAALVVRGDRHMIRAEYDRAAALYGDALVLDPRNVDASFKRGNALIYLG